MTAAVKPNALKGDVFRFRAELLSAFDSLNATRTAYRTAASAYWQAGDFHSAVSVYLQLGQFLSDRGEFDSSLTVLTVASDLAKAHRFDRQYAQSLTHSGMVLMRKGDLPQAQQRFVKALAIFRDIKDSAGIGEAWNNIGLVHWKEGKNRDALAAYTNALEIREQIGDSVGIAGTYSNMGIIYRLEKNYDVSLHYYQLSLAIRERNNDQKGISQLLSNIGSLKMETGSPAEALEYYRGALAIKEKIHDQYGKLSCYLNIGTALEAMGNLKEAEAQYLGGLRFSDSIGSLDFSRSFHRELAELYASQKNYEKAYEQHVLYMAAKDSLINRETNHELAELQAVYDLSEKQRRIDNYKQQEILTAEKEAREKTFLYALAAIVLLVLISLVIIYSRARALKAANSQLAESKMLLEKRSQEKEILLREIHHRVKNNLQLTSSLLNLQARQTSNPDASQVLKDARDRIKAISLVHQKLFSRDEYQSVNLAEYLPELCRSVFESHSIRQPEIKLETEIQPLVVSIDDSISIGLFINEALINALKHAFTGKSKGCIRVYALQQQDEMLVGVNDNGNGIPGTIRNDEEGGFGMQLLRSLSVKLQARLEISNEAGTSVRIFIPQNGRR